MWRWGERIRGELSDHRILTLWGATIFVPWLTTRARWQRPKSGFEWTPTTLRSRAIEIYGRRLPRPLQCWKQNTSVPASQWNEGIILERNRLLSKRNACRRRAQWKSWQNYTNWVENFIPKFTTHLLLYSCSEVRPFFVEHTVVAHALYTLDPEMGGGGGELFLLSMFWLHAFNYQKSKLLFADDYLSITWGQGNTVQFGQ